MTAEDLDRLINSINAGTATPAEMLELSLHVDKLKVGRSAAVARVASLEAERDAAIKQGQADHRALHDALGWAHGWHGLDLPAPWRAVTALINQHNEAVRERSEGWTRANAAESERDALRERVEVLEGRITELHAMRREAESRLAAIRQRAGYGLGLLRAFKGPHVGPIVTWLLEVGCFIVGDDPAPEAHAPQTDDLAAVEQWRENQEAKAEPSTAEAFARARECLGMCEADSIQEDGLYALSLLERRMGAMERALRNLRDYAAGFEAWTSPPPVIAEATAALTDAPDVFTREEVERVLLTNTGVDPDELQRALNAPRREP